MRADVLPRGSSPWPGPVTSLFYRIGRPRPGPVYTSRHTAAGVSSPSWWTGAGRDEKGVERKDMSSCKFPHQLCLVGWLNDSVRQGDSQVGRMETATRSSRCSSQWQSAQHCATLYCGASQWALRSAAGGPFHLSWRMASWCGRGTSGRKHRFFLTTWKNMLTTSPFHLTFPFIPSFPITPLWYPFFFFFFHCSCFVCSSLSNLKTTVQLSYKRKICFHPKHCPPDCFLIKNVLINDAHVIKLFVIHQHSNSAVLYD